MAFQSFARIQMEGCLSIEEFTIRASISPHTHDFLELAYITKGSVRHTMGERTAVIHPHQYILVDNGVAHAYSKNGGEEAEGLNCLFKPSVVDKSLRDAEQCRDILSHYLVNAGFSLRHRLFTDEVFEDEDGSVLALLEKMSREQAKRAIGYETLVRSYLIEILIQTMRKSQPDRFLASRPDGDILRMLERIEEELPRAVPLYVFARESGYSPGSLSKRFKKQTGMGYAAYIQQRRLEYACRLLADTQAAIPVVAERAGYLDVKFFNRLFKSVLGMTPRDYRRQMNAH